MKKFLGLLPFLFLVNTHAAGTIDYLKIDKDVVLFSTTETKTNTSPACTTTENVDIWSTSLKSESGRAIYSLLVMAMDKNMGVDVTSSQDCGDIDEVERADSVNLVIAPIAPLASSAAGGVGMYKSDGVTRVGTIINVYSDLNSWYYVDYEDSYAIKVYRHPNTMRYISYDSYSCGGNALLDYQTAVRHDKYSQGMYFVGDITQPNIVIKSQRDVDNNSCTNVWGKTGYPMIEAEDPLCGKSACIIKAD